jgi:hypothetical protein
MNNKNVRNLLLTEKARKRQRRASTPVPEPAAEIEIAAEADEDDIDHEEEIDERQVEFDVGKTRQGGDALWLGGKFLLNVNES